MNVVRNLISKTPFFNFLTRNAVNQKNSDTNMEPSLIKGNINSKGQKIAHIPGGRFYDLVKPVETFTTVEEAENAGYRLSKQ